MSTRLTRFVGAVVKPLATDFLRGHLRERLKDVNPDDLIATIERMDTNMLSKASQRDREIMEMAMEKFSAHLDMLNTQNVFKWLAQDLPFIGGVIYGHPKGVQWLNGVINNIRKGVTIIEKLPPPPTVELMELDAKPLKAEST